MKEIHPVALFRLSVLGPLISRDRLEIGELQRVLIELSQKSYAIPGTDRCRVGVKTLDEPGTTAGDARASRALLRSLGPIRDAQSCLERFRL